MSTPINTGRISASPRSRSPRPEVHATSTRSRGAERWPAVNDVPLEPQPQTETETKPATKHKPPAADILKGRLMYPTYYEPDRAAVALHVREGPATAVHDTFDTIAFVLELSHSE